MRYYYLTFFLLTSLILVGCRTGITNIAVSPDSEMGRKMLEMDAKARAFQNAPMFSKALRDYGTEHGGTCADIVFDRLREPGGKISRYVGLYMMEGVSPACGRHMYHARITFDDLPHTVAKRVEILERIDNESGYQEKAMEFVRYAQAGDVQQMLRITSPLSHATQTDSMRSLYANEVIPQFQGTEVAWESHGEYSHDEKYNPGLMFLGTARGKKTFSFIVTVAKEDGTLVVLGIRKSP